MTRLAIACCLLGLATAGAADDQARLRGLKQEIGAGERRIEQTDAERRALERALQTAETEIARLRRRQGQLAAEIASAERELTRLEAQRADTEAQGQRQLQRLHDDIAIAYRLGRSEPLKVLLNQEDPLAADRMMQYYGYLVAARAEQLAGLRATVAELGALTATVAAERAQLETRRTALAQELAQLDATAQQRRTLVGALAEQLADERARLHKMAEEARRLQRLLDDLARAPAAAGSGAFASQAGRLPWPAAGRLLNRYGASRASSLAWSGWMIAAREGDAVRAVHAGTVVFADYLRGHGELIILDHGGGYLTLYAHNQSLLKSVGETVNGGDVIARAGNSGGLRESALYFEIRRGGKTLDPALWLRKPS